MVLPHLVNCVREKLLVRQGLNNFCSKLEFFIPQSDTPAEILARGPDALKAYNDASKEGTSTVDRARLVFVGQEGAGKTSLINNLSGQGY